MDLKQIRTFLALYEEGSVTKAALRLHLVQPAVSQQMRRIESDFGVTLFTRTSQGLEPTPLADELYTLCCRVAQDVEQVGNYLAQARGRLSGTLALGVPPSLAHGVLVDILQAFQARASDVRIRIQEGYSADLKEWLVSGQLDLAVMTAFGRDDRLTARALVSDDLVLAYGNGLDALATDAIDAARLAHLPLVLPSARNTLRTLVDTELARVGLHLEPRMEVDSLAIVMRLLETGEWASVLPAIALVKGLASRKLRMSRIVNPALSRQLVIAHKSSRELSAAAEAFVATLSEGIRESSIDTVQAPHRC
jgi:DNA-binding transcriptional LysR family regulator